MERTPKKTARLGDIIVVAFDEAMKITSDPRRAATLAAQAVERLLRGTPRRRLLDTLGSA